MKPVRLRLSRRKGFDLQATSRSFNGLDAVNVSRPGPWGNPFTVTTKVRSGVTVGGYYVAVPTIEDAIECFREMVSITDDLSPRLQWMHQHFADLQGKNLACWCPLPPPGQPDLCHAAVLLEIVNPIGPSETE